MAAYDPSKPIRTLLQSNLFRFVCPIFGSATELRVCLHLRDLLWAGKKQDVRRGCQACMHDSKCPAVHIVRDAWQHGKDDYFSAEPKQGALKETLLDRIRNICVTDRTMNDFGITETERKHIQAVSVYNAPLRGKADRDGKLIDLPDIAAPVVASKPRKSAETITTSTTTAAAVSGDLSAAISTGEAA